MDDLILAGTLAIAVLYAAAILVVSASFFALAELYRAVVTGDAGHFTAILVIVLLLLTAYAGTGLWLRKSGRI
jgi:hypothetical protein